MENENLDTLIVLFDIANYSRQEIGEYIDKIRSFGPAAIAVQVMFESKGDPVEDSILSESIINSSKIVLCERIDNSDLSVRMPYELFRNGNEGVLSYTVDEEDIARTYTPLYQDGAQQYLGFPHQVLFTYDFRFWPDFKKLKVNEEVDIVCHKNSEEFFVIDKLNMSLATIQDKIVIMGSLNPETDGYFALDDHGSKIRVTGVVVTANILLDLIK